MTERIPEDALMGKPVDIAYPATMKELIRSAILDAGTANRIGRYELTGVLGSGAMGSVFAAFDPKLNRPVAIKVVREEASPARSRLQARLFQEARALARLSHPNVVGVFEIGKSAGSRFIVMEKVEGEPLDLWIRKPRPWRQILGVFAQAGRGLAACHASGLIHRDFKPANAIIGARGRVRVVDFGLVRTVSPTLPDSMGDETIVSGDEGSQTGVVGTPAYLAPECYTGAPATAAADQFGFCVSLHEALYGVRPFAGSTWNEIRAATLSHRHASPTRGSDVPAWVRQVVLRGVRRDPRRRYRDMRALVDALERGTRSKWLTRSIGVAAVVGVCAAIVSDNDSHSHSVERCDAQLRARSIETPSSPSGPLRQLDAPFATRTADDVDAAVREYAAELAQAEHSTCAAGPGTDASLLRRGAACLQARRFALDAALEFFAAVDRDGAARALEITATLPPIEECTNAARLRESPAPPSEARTAAAVSELRAHLGSVRAAVAAARFDDAKTSAAQALQRAFEIGYVPAIAEAQMVVGNTHHNTGDDGAAQGAFAAAYYTALEANALHLAARAALQVADVTAVSLSDNDAADRWLAHAMSLYARLEGEEHPDAGYVMQTKARLAVARGDTLLAVRLMERAVEREAQDPKPSPDRLPGMYSELSGFLYRAGEAQRAAEIAEKAAAAVEELQGPNHPALAGALHNLCLVQLDRGYLREAERAARRALSINRDMAQDEHPDVARSRVNLGLVLAKQGRFAKAEPLLRKATDALRATDGDSPHVAIALTNLGLALAGQERWAEAAAALREGIAIVEATLGAEHSLLTAMLEPLALVRVGEGRLDEAEELQARVVDLREATYGTDSWLYWSARSMMSVVSAARGDHAAAAEQCEAALERISQAPNGKALIVTIAPICAEALENSGELRRGLRRAQQAVDSIGGQNAHRDLIVAWAALGRLRGKTGDRPGAVLAYARAVGIADELELNDPEIEAVRSSYAIAKQAR